MTKKPRPKKSYYTITPAIASKVLLAVAGGYMLANLASIVFLMLPINPISSLAWGKIAGVLVCAVAVVYIFSVSAKQAWITIVAINALLYALCMAVFGSVGL